MYYHLLKFSAKVLIGLSVKMRERQNTEVPACLPPMQGKSPLPSAPCYVVVPNQCLLNEWVGSQLENEGAQNREDRDRGQRQSFRFF